MFSLSTVFRSTVFFCYFSMALATEHRAALNVLGRALALCGTSPMTGFYRDGYCRTDVNDHGVHVISAVLTDEFLDFTKSRGNDLSTPRGASFPGLRAGDRWCLCALRWREAFEAGKAPLVDLEATNEAALKFVTLEQLKSKSM